jgi:hypothetical protein
MSLSSTAQSTGSVSSFTESDTSFFSSSSSGANDEESEPSNTIQPRASTPPPAPMSKPPSIAVRSRSVGLPQKVGLPPLNPSSSFANTPVAATRNRCDTGEFTRTSATTNTSRHRRAEQFQFSPLSMGQIWPGTNATTDEATAVMPPPSFVLCEEACALRRDSGYISALDDDLDNNMEDWGSCDYNGDNDDDDEDSYSPFAQLERKRVAEERRRPQNAVTRKKNRPKQQKPPKPEPTLVVPEYLRKSPALEHVTEGNLVLSGWIAVSFGTDSFEVRLQEGSKLKAADIFYMRIVETNGEARIMLHKWDGATEHSFPLDRDWMCVPREITSRAGRCVTLQSRTTAGVVATLLPVSLDDTFFLSGEKLVSSKQFSRIHDKLFVSGRGKVYAPDEQHDAAMYIMFSLDALIKNCGR